MSYSSIQAALKIFHEALAETPYADQPVNLEGFPNSVTAKHMVEPSGWLPRLMFRSDEIFISMTAHRLWDCSYLTDSNTIEGFAVTDTSPSKEEYPLAENVPLYLRKECAKQAIAELFYTSDKKVSLKPINYPFFSSPEKDEDGCHLYLPSEIVILAGRLAEFSKDFCHGQKITPKTPDLSPY